MKETILVLIAVLFLGGCAAVPDAPTTEIVIPLADNKSATYKNGKDVDFLYEKRDTQGVVTKIKMQSTASAVMSQQVEMMRLQNERIDKQFDRFRTEFKSAFDAFVNKALSP